MNVYRITARGFDNTHYIVSAMTLAKAIQVVEDEQVANIDFDYCWELVNLSTDLTVATIIEQF